MYKDIVLHNTFLYLSPSFTIYSVFLSVTGWKMPVIIKRLDARYDWLMGRWSQPSYQLVDAGDGCDPSTSVAGAVAWVSEGSCSFFTKVRLLLQLIYTLRTFPLILNKIHLIEGLTKD